VRPTILYSLNELVSEAISDFRKVVALARADFPSDGITIDIALKPHRPPRPLLAGHVAVYVFFRGGQALKVGKAGANSAARYTSQHYNPKGATSTLARSILTNAAKVGAVGVAPGLIGDWIKEHTDRVNLLMPTASGLPILSLLESFLHVRWRPLFEGRPDDD